MQSFHKFIRTTHSLSLPKSYLQLEKPYDIVKFAAYIEGMAIFLPKPFYAKKNNDEAQESREKGNEFFKKGDFKKAFFHYTIAVMKAEYPDENVNSTVHRYIVV